MSVKKTNSAVTRHVAFSVQEDELIRKLAEESGMSISPFIRKQALEGHVTSIDWSVVTQHILYIDRIASDIRTLTTSPHPNRWEYEGDLDFIMQKLDDLISAEHELLLRLQDTA